MGGANGPTAVTFCHTAPLPSDRLLDKRNSELSRMEPQVLSNHRAAVTRRCERAMRGLHCVIGDVPGRKVVAEDIKFGVSAASFTSASRIAGEVALIRISF